jgi:spermidine synthase
VTTTESLWRLGRASFSILFLELVLIRWIPSYVRLFGYFTNFILLGSLLGAGIGILTHRGARVRLPGFPVLLLVLVGLVLVNQYSLNLPSTDVLFYGAAEKSGSRENDWVIPVIFTSVVLVFVPLGRTLGALLAALPPLRAYGVDIAGSLVGIAAFAALCQLSLPPVVWFASFFVVAWPLVAGEDRRFNAFVVGGILLLVFLAGMHDLWSPYYRITVTPTERHDGYVIAVNNIGHQEASPAKNREGFYHRAYELLGTPAFRRVLIIGAGSGTDVAVALANGAEHVDAVEIDPQLYALGRKLHPDHPYDDPRVTAHIDDGRAFLRQSTERYDLIVYALTDSLRLTSSHANLRLESFLLTAESLRSARAHLSDRGLLVLYNYYREDWSIRKLAGMVTDAFGAQPYVTSYGAWGRAAVLMSGPRLAALPSAYFHPYSEPPLILPTSSHAGIPVVGEGMLAGDPGLRAASDDWPFFYLAKPGIAGVYLIGIVMVLALAVALGVGLTPSLSLRRFDAHFFWLGVAFMLLETRSLVTFALLFGTTWMVNALVFFAILSSVLLAIVINAKLRLRRVGWLYAALFALLVLNYFLPVGRLLEVGSSGLRYALASGLAFAPIFVANLVFSRSFRDTERADSAFASNLLGITVGGLVEYAALVAGYQALLVPVMAFYGVALLLDRRSPPGS